MRYMKLLDRWLRSVLAFWAGGFIGMAVGRLLTPYSARDGDAGLTVVLAVATSYVVGFAVMLYDTPPATVHPT